MDEYSLFKTYVALKTHFTVDEYDFLKYDGKVRITEVSFKKRKDYMMFYTRNKYWSQNIWILSKDRLIIRKIMMSAVKCRGIFFFLLKVL